MQQQKAAAATTTDITMPKTPISSPSQRVQNMINVQYNFSGNASYQQNAVVNNNHQPEGPSVMANGDEEEEADACGMRRKKNNEEETDKQFKHQSGDVMFDESSGAVIIPDDMFDAKFDVSLNRADQFFDYYFYLDHSQRRTQSRHPKMTEHVKIFRDILKTI
jgi:hypothetical protein